MLSQDPTVFDGFSKPTRMRSEDDQSVSWLRKAEKLFSEVSERLVILN